MVKLVETYHLAKSKKYTLASGAEAFYISAIGDGNCGIYAFASGVVDLIKSDSLNLSPIIWNEFYREIRASIPLLKKRIAFYRGQRSDFGGSPYTDLADPLENIVSLIEKTPNLDFASFKNFVLQQNTRHQIAALTVAMGPAIRAKAVEVSIDALKENPDADTVQRGAELAAMAEDGVEIGQELIDQVARDFFKINVDIYDLRADRPQPYLVNLKNPLPSAPQFSVLHTPDHWGYLLPLDQRDGLASLPVFEEKSALAAIKSNDDHWDKLKKRAECEKNDPNVNGKVISYFFFDTKNEIKVTKKLQEALDEEFARKLQEEEYQNNKLGK